jgi:hypothetical protein
MKYVTGFFRGRAWIFLFLLLPLFASTNCVPMGAGGNRFHDNTEYNIDDLNNYGEWVYLDRFGRVWRPWVADDWRPFVYGHWVYDGDDWVWDSYEPYGWLVYHYGNWYYDPDYGWVWIPGRVWSRARVVWVNYDDYIGWAPIPPAGIAWDNPWESSGIMAWNIIYYKDFDRDNIGNYRMAKPPRSLDSRRVIIVNKAPKIEMVQEYTRHPVTRIIIRRDEVSDGRYKYQRIRVPDDELKRNEVFRQEVRETVLRPKKDVRQQPQPPKEIRSDQEQTETRKNAEQKEIEQPKSQPLKENKSDQEQKETRKNAEQKEVEQPKPQPPKENKSDQEQKETRKDAEKKEIEQPKTNNTGEEEKPAQQQEEVKQKPVEKEHPVNPPKNTKSKSNE